MFKTLVILLLAIIAAPVWGPPLIIVLGILAN